MVQLRHTTKTGSAGLASCLICKRRYKRTSGTKRGRDKKEKRGGQEEREKQNPGKMPDGISNDLYMARDASEWSRPPALVGAARAVVDGPDRGTFNESRQGCHVPHRKLPPQGSRVLGRLFFRPSLVRCGAVCETACNTRASSNPAPAAAWPNQRPPRRPQLPLPSAHFLDKWDPLE